MKRTKRYLFLFLFCVVIGLNATEIELRIPNITAEVGDVIDIPVFADTDLSYEKIYSYQLQINFEPEIISVNEIVIAGALSESFGLPFCNSSVPGQLIIATAGAVPLIGIGEFLYLRAEILQSGFLPVSFMEENSFFNEGNPGILFTNGSVSQPSSANDSANEQPNIVIRNYQNPFRFSAKISFEPYRKDAKNTEISIYNVKGQKIRTLECGNNVTVASTFLMHSTQWDRTNEQNVQVSNGIYFCQIQYRNNVTLDEPLTNNLKKLVLLR